MTDEEIAIAHMTLWDAETVEDADRMRQHWRKHFSDMAADIHSGDCIKQPCACCRCLAEEAIRMVPVYRALFGLSDAPPSNPASEPALSQSSASDGVGVRPAGDGAVAGSCGVGGME